MQAGEHLINCGLAIRSDVQKGAFSISQFGFTTREGRKIVVQADDKFKVILGSYPTYSPRSGLVFKVESGRETDEKQVVDIISREVSTILGRETITKGKNVVEYCGQSSLDSDQMMTTITIALKQDARITLELTQKVSRLKMFLTKLRLRSRAEDGTVLNSKEV
jgi:hypothetical protein